MTGAGSILIAGTSSDAGKSAMVAGICRWLHRRGVRVAPFKAQNMSNNSVVVVDDDVKDGTGIGGEIGRAQAFQAAACGLEPSVRFNPVLLKPGSDMSSQAIVNGRVAFTIGAGSFAQARPVLAQAAFAAFDDLRSEFDVVVCEGAGSPTEINLREHDFVNMGLAQYGNLPVLVVGDIDRGGVFAALHGTLALLSRVDQRLIAGFLINKFRGDIRLLRPGIDTIERLTGRPTLGVVPWSPDLWIDSEDSLSSTDGRVIGRPGLPVGSQWLRVAAVRLPHISNGTDIEALACEPGVVARLTTSPAELADADLIVIPGSKCTVDDLDWLRATGLAAAITAHLEAGRPVLGICGGFQMLGRAIHDDVESGRGRAVGLGLLPIETTFAPDKTVCRSSGTAYGASVSGYEIHHGYVSSADPAVPPLIVRLDGSGEGAVVGGVYGTHWHGAFESDDFRRAFLVEVAARAGRTGFVPSTGTIFGAQRERTLELLADLVEENVDTELLWRLIDEGPTMDLPFILPGAGSPT